MLLPAVSVSPSAANGLVGCRLGNDGIGLDSEMFPPHLENRCGGSKPACEPGESPAPLQGYVFIAQPKCGGSGQAACTGEDAEDGALFSGYAELSGDGVLIKEHAAVLVDREGTRSLTATFRELP